MPTLREPGATPRTGPPIRVAATPYEKYLEVVRVTLSRLPAVRARFGRAAELVQTGYRIRYQRTRLYQPRAADEVERTGYGDCKDKAHWLADRLGDDSVRFVIGRSYPHSSSNHAWVEWDANGTTWILDPTLHSAPRDRRLVPSGRFIPLWSYTKEGAWEHRV